MSTTLADPRTAAPPPGARHEAPRPARAGALARAASWRLGLPALLALTAVLYLWDLAASGWANDYYAAAAQAGGSSWKALLFGSLDAASSITVDKPPASLWAMGLSVRVFGLSAWSLLVPQALMGVAAVGLLAATVRRVAGPAAGLVAGLVLALTPVAALMFRFDNPDALLTLLLVVAAWATTRALARGSLLLLGVAGSAVGLAFLTKMLQAFLVLPALALVVLVAFPGPVRRRLAGLGAGVAGIVATAGPYLALVEWWPFGDRPYIGGSQHDSILELTLGYNGLERLSGGSGPGGGGMGGTGFGGQAGLTRLLGDSMGTQIGWLVPAALVALAAGLLLTRRAPRLDPTRAALLLWGGWLVVSGLVFSLMSGIVHPYYTVALAPAIGALVAIGGALLLRHRARLLARLALAATAAGSAAWAVALLDRTPDWQPWLRPVVLAGGALAALLALVPPGRLGARVHGTALGAALAVALLAAPLGFTLSTVTTAHAGSIPMAGPTTAEAGGGPGGAGGAPPQGASLGAPPQGAQDGAPPQGGGSSGAGGPGRGATSAELVALLAAADDATWAAATVGAQSAAGLQLASGAPVMAIGGFTGSDPSPTLAAFQALVADGQVRYLIAGGQGGRGGPGGSGTASAITEWVAASFTATTVGGQTVYDLAQPLA